MATVIHNPQSIESENSIASVIGIVLLIALVGIFLLFGLPRLVGGGTGQSVNLPNNVNVNTGK